MARLNVFELLTDQFRFLSHPVTGRPVIITRALVVLIAPIMAVISYKAGWTMQSVSEMVGALGLLAGVFISAFAIVFSLRLTLDRQPGTNLKRSAARLMDESALTLLSTGLLAGVDAMWLSIVSAMTIPSNAISSELTAISVGLSALVVLFFLLSIRRLHVLYTDSFPPFWRVSSVVHGSGDMVKSDKKHQEIK